MFQHLKDINTDIALDYLVKITDIWQISDDGVQNSLVLLLLEKVKPPLSTARKRFSSRVTLYLNVLSN